MSLHPCFNGTRHSRLRGVGWSCTCFLLLLVNTLSTASAEPVTPEMILKAWEERTASIKSLHYTFNQRTISSQSTPGPFDDEPLEEPRKPTELVSKLVFNKQNEKLAMTIEGDVLDANTHQKRWNRYRVAFSGTDNRRALEGGLLDFGDLTESDPPAADSQITRGSTLMPIHLSISPQIILKEMIHEVKQMRIENPSISHAGRKCVVVDIPRGGKGWRTTMTLEEEPPYLPVRFELSKDGNLAQVIEMTHENDAARHYPLVSFQQSQFDGKGHAEKIVLGTAEKSSVNVDLPASAFVLEFPVGAHLRHAKADGTEEYFIQEEGRRRKIPASEYSTLRKSKNLPTK